MMREVFGRNMTGVQMAAEIRKLRERLNVLAAYVRADQTDGQVSPEVTDRACAVLEEIANELPASNPRMIKPYWERK